MPFTLRPSGVSRPRQVGSITTTTYKPEGFQACLEDHLSGVFFNTKHFAMVAQYTHIGDQEPETYDVIFDDPNEDVGVGLSADFDGLQPQFKIKKSEWKQKPRKEDKVNIKGIVYFVNKVDPDGVGVDTVFLRRK